MADHIPVVISYLYHRVLIGMTGEPALVVPIADDYMAKCRQFVLQARHAVGIVLFSEDHFRFGASKHGFVRVLGIARVQRHAYCPGDGSSDKQVCGGKRVVLHRGDTVTRLYAKAISAFATRTPRSHASW